MECRPQCGACCIEPSIAQPFFGMPDGKPAGERCVHLDAAMACQLFADSRRPIFCSDFAAELEVCGATRAQAVETLRFIEHRTQPAAK